MGSNPTKSERRREPRVDVNTSLAILCTDGAGNETHLQAQLIDISAKGAKMRVLGKVQRGTAVHFFSHKLNIGGRGTVRYCNPHKRGYEIGLEFPGGTGWKGMVGADLISLAEKVGTEKLDAEKLDAEKVIQPPAEIESSYKS